MITYKELKFNYNKGKYNNFYLLISKDFYRINTVLNLFKKQISSELNFTYIDINNVEDAKEITNICNTYPIFDTKRIVFINNVDLSRHKKELDILIKYIPKMPKETILLMAHYVTDKRENYNKNTVVSKLEKAVSNSVVYSPNITLEELNQIAVEEGIKIDNKILNLLLTADNLDVARNDLIKLSFLNPDNLTLENAEKYISSSSEIDVFNLTEAIKERNLEKSLVYINNLKDKGENEIVLTIMLTKTFKLLYDCKILKEIGLSEGDIATRLKMHHYPVKLACKQAEKFPIETLSKAIDLCLQYDIDFKKGVKSSLDILIIKILAI